MSNTLEPPPEDEAARPLKINIREFLNRYRQLGLPNAKKFRKRTRLAQLEGERDFAFRALQNGAFKLAAANNHIRLLLDGMTCNSDDQTTHWVGEEKTLTEAEAFIDRVNGASGARLSSLQPAPKSPPIDTGNGDAS
jgi:hypothetical protein